MIMPAKELLKIGELAQMFQVLPSTINFYTREGLLKAAGFSQGGYRLYDAKSASQLFKKIQYLQTNKRLTLSEIKQAIK
jgi:DNA-binding transcriptional MerR regulator